MAAEWWRGWVRHVVICGRKSLVSCAWVLAVCPLGLLLASWVNDSEHRSPALIPSWGFVDSTPESGVDVSHPTVPKLTLFPLLS